MEFILDSVGKKYEGLKPTCEMFPPVIQDDCATLTIKEWRRTVEGNEYLV